MFKLIGHHWQTRRERFYKKNRWHLVLDFSLAITIILLAAILITLKLYNPKINRLFTNNFPEKTEINLNNPPLVYSYSLASSSLNIEDGVVLNINLKNSSDLSLEDIKSSLVIIDNNFSITKIENQGQGSDINISNQDVSFGSLAPKEEKNLTFKVTFGNKINNERVIKWQARNEYSVQNQTIKSTTSLPDVMLAAELNAHAVVYYNSPQGDQLGSGPLPPVIGLPTNYWIFFDVKSDSDFKTLVFSAKLPKGVELTDRRSLLAGDLKYNSATRQIVWMVPELKNQSDSYRVGFEVSFTPVVDQLGKTPIILNNIKYYALDSLLNTNVGSSLPNLSTNLDDDLINKGQGKISQP